MKTRINNSYLEFFLLGKMASEINIPLCGSNSWVYQGHASLGRIFLTHIVYKAFQIHRLPGFDEKYYKIDHTDHKVIKFFDDFPLEEIDHCVKEILRLYEHTQVQIKNSSEIKIYDGKVFLKRGLRNDLSRALKLTSHKARLNGETKVVYVINTISPYAVGSGFASHGAYIKEWVRVEDILLCHKTIDGWPEDEFLVINRHPKGYATLDITNCEIEAPDTGDYQRFVKSATLREALEFVYAYQQYEWYISRHFPLRAPRLFEKIGKTLDTILWGERYKYYRT